VAASNQREQPSDVVLVVCAQGVISSIHRDQAASASPPSGDEIDPKKPIENTEKLRIA
jgi:hypothetical protein